MKTTSIEELGEETRCSEIITEDCAGLDEKAQRASGLCASHNPQPIVEGPAVFVLKGVKQLLGFVQCCQRCWHITHW